MSTQISKSTLRSIHQQQLMTGNSNTDNTMELMHILGGIDSILSQFLSESSNISLSDDQLHQINQIVSKSGKSSMANTYKSNADYQVERDIAEEEIVLTLNESDTFLHSVFGSTKGSTILRIIYSRFVAVAVILLIITNAIIVRFMSDSIGKSVIIIILCGFIWTPYTIFWMLSMNRKAFWLIVRSFEFWLKVTYAFLYGIFNVWYEYKYHISQHGDTYRAFGLMNGITNSIIGFPMGVACVSLLDASNMKRIWKICLTIACASVVTISAILDTTAEYYDDNNDSTVYVSNVLKFRLLTLIASAIRICCIFFWRQAILQIRKSKSIGIRYAPRIKWNDVTATDYFPL